MSGTGVYDILNPIMDDLAIGLAQGSRRFNQYMEQTIAFNNVQQAVDHANAWQESPTAHREAETAKAHRG